MNRGGFERVAKYNPCENNVMTPNALCSVYNMPDFVFSISFSEIRSNHHPCFFSFSAQHVPVLSVVEVCFSSFFILFYSLI